MWFLSAVPAFRSFGDSCGRAGSSLNRDTSKYNTNVQAVLILTCHTWTFCHGHGRHLLPHKAPIVKYLKRGWVSEKIWDIWLRSHRKSTKGNDLWSLVTGGAWSPFSCVTLRSASVGTFLEGKSAPRHPFKLVWKRCQQPYIAGTLKPCASIFLLPSTCTAKGFWTCSASCRPHISLFDWSGSKWTNISVFPSS